MVGFHIVEVFNKLLEFSILRAIFVHSFVSVDFQFFRGFFYGIFCVVPVPTSAAKVPISVDFQLIIGAMVFSML